MHVVIRWSIVAALGCYCVTLTGRVGAAEPTASPRAAVTPERLSTAIARLEELAQHTLATTGVPGIGIAVVHQDQVVLKRGFGVRDSARTEPIDADTVFQVASVSKPLAATVLAAVVGEKKIDWDDRVIDHDPQFRMYDPYVTRELRLRDLLCHRSGLPDHAGDLLEDFGYDAAEVIRRLRYQPPDSSFRAQYAYTNFGFSEAGYAAAKACGVSWPELAAEKLFRPAGMKATSYRFADYEAAPNRALLHARVDGKWVAKNTRRPDAQAPAGGASSTLNDLVQWMRLLTADGQLEGRQIVPAEALAETHVPQFVLGFTPAQGRLSSYAFGWMVSIERGGRVFWKHSGSFTLGVRTEIAVLPAERLAIVVLSNASPTGVPEGLVESFFDLALDGALARDWIEFANRMFDEEIQRELGAQRDYRHPPEKPRPPLAAGAYTGRYGNDFFGDIEIAERHDALVLRVGPQRIEYPLRHWDRDVYIYQPAGESAGGPGGLLFSIAPDGRADGILIENLDIHGQGRFTRRD